MSTLTICTLSRLLFMVIVKDMDYEKAKLSPIDSVDEDKQELSPAQIEAKKELKRHRAETQRYKQKYFEYYDDVKINHREDW